MKWRLSDYAFGVVGGEVVALSARRTVNIEIWGLARRHEIGVPFDGQGNFCRQRWARHMQCHIYILSI